MNYLRPSVKVFLKLWLFAVLVLLVVDSNAQISVTATAGTAGPTSYTTLKGAFDAINAGTHQGTITISVTGNTTETAPAVLNASGSGSASYASVAISPSGGAARTISGAITAGSPLIDLNGADNVTFNGLNTGGNSLTLSNTTTGTTSGTCTVRFLADASNNTITKCSVLGSSTMTATTNGGNIYFATGTTTGNDNNTISNCLITGIGSNLPSKGVYCNGSTTSNSIQNSGNAITNNEIYDIFVNGVTNGAIYVSTGNTSMTISNNKIYQTASRTISTASTHYGIFVSNSGSTAMGENFTISGNTIGYNNNSGTGTMTYAAGTTAGGFQAISFLGTASSSASNTNAITNNIISNIQWTSTTTSTFYGINSTLANTTSGAILNITGNTVQNMTFVTSTSTFTGIVTGYAPTTNVTNNTVTNLTRSGSSTLYGINYTGTSSTTVNISGNTVSSLSNTNTSSASTLYGIFSASAPATENIYNNTIDGLTGSSTSSLTIYGIYSLTATSGNKTFYGNTIKNLTNSSSGTGTSAGIRSGYLGTTNGYYNNIIFNITGNTSVYGMYLGGSSAATNAVSNVYSNKIYGLSSSVASPTVCGILTTTGTTFNIYNNVIGDLTTPSANSAIPLYGIYASGGTNANIYYNTVRLNATSGGALFGSAALYASSTVLVDLRNNILINTSTAVSTGITSAFRRTGAYSTTYYASTSNNNLYYAGAPSASNLLFYDGTNSAQDLTALRTLFTGTRDNVSVSESLTFASTTGSATNYLELSGSTATQAESGGQHITGYSDSYGATSTRTSGLYPKSGQVNGGGTMPDIGAYEGDYTLADLTAPSISYTALTNTANTTARTLTVTITDASGVPNTGPGLPMLYWNINSGPYSGVTGTYVSGNTYTFSFGGGVSTGDIINYYVVAQDNAGSPNVGVYPSAGASGFSFNPPAAAGAPTSPSTYTILSTISGTFNVGASQTYATLAAAITDLNNKVIVGAVVLNLMSDYTGESSYPLTLPSLLGSSGTNTITIRPDAGISSTITLTSASTSGTVIFNGGQYYVIDGRPGGAGGNKYISIVNTSTTAASAGNAILLYNEASNNTLTYLDVQSANANAAVNTAVTTSGSIPGAIAIGTTSGSNGNDNNTISYCDIHSTGANLGACIYAGNSTAAGNASNNDNNTIANNNLYDFFIAGSASAALDIAVGNNTYTITDNKVYQTATRTYTSTQTVRGFWITPNTGSLTSASGYTITGNTIGYSSSAATGKMTLAGSTSYVFYGMDISVGLGTATSIQNNTLAGWDITGSFSGGNNIMGITVANGAVNVGTVTGNLIGSNSATGDITITSSSAATSVFIGLRSGGGSTINFSNNTISGIDLAVTSSATTNTNGFNAIAASGGTTVNITNNTIGSSSVANSINITGASSTSSTAQVARCITINGATTVSCTGNTIANINTNYTGTATGATMAGIYITSGTVTVSNNSIYKLYSNSLNSNAGGSTPTIGGIIWTTTTSNATISGNTIHSLSANNASNAGNVYITGIYYAGPTSGTNVIEKNNIHSISFSGTGTGSYITGMDIASGLVTISNNMLRLGLDENGNAVTTACTVRGITKNTASSSIYNNTIYIGGTGVGTTATNTFALVKTGAPVSSDDWRNNILINQRSNATTGGKHYSIYLSATASLTLNYNSYYGSGTGYVFGYNGTADVLSYSSGWITGDAASFNSDPNLIAPTGTSSTVDLHVNTGVASVAESGGTTISGITTDIDGNPRQGQAGYAGTGTAPDIGADEFNGISAPNMAFSSATVSQETGTSYPNSTAQRVLQILITTTGSLNPVSATSFTVNANGSTSITDISSAKIYYTGSSSTFSTNTLFGTNATPTIANFTITGSQVLSAGNNYFWLAYDVSGSATGGNALDGECSSVTVAGLANSISPSAPAGARDVGYSLSGSYNIGAAQTSPNYTTITSAIADLTTRGVSGAVTFNLVDATYSVSETFPISIGAIAGANGTNTITLKPGTGVNASITGSSSTSIFKLSNTDYFIIDGSNNGSSTRNLTIENTNTGASSAVVWLSSAGTGSGATYNTIKNCNIKAGVAQNATATVTIGITLCGTSISIATGGADNDYNTIQNNYITKVRYGVTSVGVSNTNPNTNNTISQNVIGPNEGFGANEIGQVGVFVQNETVLTINANTIQYVGGDYSNTPSTGVDRGGIIVSTGIALPSVAAAYLTNSSITGNFISNIIEERTFSAAGIAYSAVDGTNNTQNIIANNSISNVKANGTSGDASAGMFLSSGKGDVIAHNSIYLSGDVDPNASATAPSTYGGACIAITNTAFVNPTIVNNIGYMDLSSSSAGASTVRYSAITIPASYSIGTGSSNFNNYYISGSNAQVNVGYQGAVSTSLGTYYTTFSGWQTLVSPLEANSFNSNPNFNSTSSLVPLLGSPVLSAGTPVASVTTDILGATRSGTNPSVGAYESGADMAGPTMTYVALVNTSSTSNRNLTGVGITDVSGVNTTAGTKPRLYYRLSTNNNTYAGNTSSDNGWKYVEASNSSSPFDFTIDYSLLFGGPVVGGNIIQYFVVAQDLVSTPNVGISNGSFAATPSSVALTAGAFPIGGTPASYTVTPSYSGAYSVGATAPTYTTLKSFFDALNAGAITGNITVNLIDNTTETASAVLNVTNEEPAASNFTITIQPSGGAARTITGNITGALIKLNGADRVTINGLNTGGNSLLISNTSTGTSDAVIWLASQATGAGCNNVTITNCTIQNGATNASTSNTSSAIFVGGTSIGSAGDDNDNLTISNNIIKKANNGIFIISSASGTSNTVSISGNTIGSATAADKLGYRGIYLTQVTDYAIDNNTISDIQSSANNVRGIDLGTGSINGNIRKNLIYNIGYTATSGYGGKAINVETGSSSSALTISNNVIYGITGDGWSSANTTDQIVGIRLNTVGGINIYNNSVYLGSGSFTGNSSGTLSAALYITSGCTTLDVRNNIFATNLVNSTAASAKTYGIYCASANTAFSNIDYNIYYGSGSQGIAGYLSSDRTDLSGIVSGFGSNSNSFVVNPGFTSATNLQITSAFPSNYRLGTSIGSVTTDYSGTTRSTPPDMGAYEGSEANRWIGGSSTAWATTSNWDNGSAPTSAGNTQIDPSASNSPVLSTTFNAGNLYIPSGKSLSLSGNTLTVSGTISGTGTVVGNGSLVMDGSGTGGTLYMDQTTAGTSNKLTNLTMNRSGETLTLGSALVLSGVFTPTAGTLATGGNLTLLSTASGDASIAAGSGSYITGNVTVQRYVPTGTNGRGYRYLAAPFSTGPNISASWQQQIYITGSGTGGTACPSLTAHSNGFDASTYNNASMTTFNETGATVTTGTSNASGGTVYSNAWSSVANTNATTLSAGKGYNVYVRGNRTQGCSQLDGSVYTPTDVTLSASGTVQTGSFSFTGVTYSASNGEGWNLVGNPYPSAIDWDHASWTKTNVLPTIWVYKVATNSYATYNTSSGGVNGGSNIIPSGTGFFIHATGTPTFAVTEAAKTSSAPATLLLKTKPFDIRVKLTKASNNFTDELLIALNREQATDAFDLALDAEKMNNPNNVNLYAIDGVNKKYAINAIAPIPDNSDKVVPLGIASPTAGSYTLNLEPVDLPSYYQVFLRDHYLQTEKQIESGTALNYAFTVNTDPASFGNSRFDLFIANNRPHSTGLQGSSASNWNLTVFPNPTEGKFTLTLSGKTADNGSITVYNSLGMQMMVITDIHQSQEIDLSNYNAGIYFVEYTNGQEVLKTIKLIKK